MFLVLCIFIQIYVNKSIFYVFLSKFMSIYAQFKRIYIKFTWNSQEFKENQRKATGYHRKSYESVYMICILVCLRCIKSDRNVEIMHILIDPDSYI